MRLVFLLISALVSLTSAQLCLDEMEVAAACVANNLGLSHRLMSAVNHCQTSYGSGYGSGYDSGYGSYYDSGYYSGYGSGYDSGYGSYGGYDSGYGSGYGSYGRKAERKMAGEEDRDTFLGRQTNCSSASQILVDFHNYMTRKSLNVISHNLTNTSDDLCIWESLGWYNFSSIGWIDFTQYQKDIDSLAPSVSSQ